MIHIDGYSPEEIEKVVDWLTSQTTKDKGGFCWANAFKSPIMLRQESERYGMMFFDLRYSEMIKSEKENRN